MPSEIQWLHCFSTPPGWSNPDCFPTTHELGHGLIDTGNSWQSTTQSWS